MLKRKRLTFYLACCSIIVILYALGYYYWLYPKFKIADYKVVIQGNPSLKGELYVLDEEKRFYLIISAPNGNLIESYYLYLNMTKEENELLFNHMCVYVPDKMFLSSGVPDVLFKGKDFAYMCRRVKEIPHPHNSLTADIKKENNDIRILITGSEGKPDFANELMIYNREILLLKTNSGI